MSAERPRRQQLHGRCPTCDASFAVTVEPDPYINIVPTPEHRTGLLPCYGVGRPLVAAIPISRTLRRTG